MKEARRYNTPCIGQCSTVFGDTVCRGCLRFVHEIIDWNRYDDDEKSVVWQRLEQLVSRIVPQYVQVDDPHAIDNAVLFHRLPYRSGNIWHNIYNLLRLAERRNLTLENCGFRLLPGYRPSDIQQHLYSLADAFYERDFVRATRMAAEQPDLFQNKA
ncbi:hypothetical protein EV700_2050 [Fluviicoccus keumensis]|uniref:Uncharacterized protein n=1 Tax=Fluviicoccus keumensis TaxID=1435465 RepID=A0A4Q7Z671_9GAMM|nr:DUF1289 domain-containing protein [Fluviicoccus keumensis]RZU45233.1 hypothetical protein EV700_2050 [Fluviicoccus keumensis]